MPTEKMTKQELFQQFKTLVEQNAITKEEILSVFDQSKDVKTDQVSVKKVGMAQIFYYIGGAIVFLGISILVYQNWSTLNVGTKILATFGSGIAAYYIGLLFGRDKKTEVVGSAFYLISGLITPLGLHVIFDSAGFDAGSHGFQSLISGALLATYLLSFFVLRKNIFVLFSIIFGTWLFFSFTSFIVGSNPYFNASEFYEYRILVVGLAYILFGYAFSKNKYMSFSGFLYGFGILGFLGAALVLGDWKPNQNAFWELIFPVLAFAVLFLSVYIKNKSFLVFGTIFLMAYILKITSEYFSSGLGWPLALVVAGLLMIAVGYMSFSLKKKYISV